MRLRILNHGGHHGLVRLNQPGLAGLLVSDGEESFVIFLSSFRYTLVLQLIRNQLQVQFGLGGRGPLSTVNISNYLGF